MIRRRQQQIAAVALTCLVLSGCGTLGRLNPFDRGGGTGARATEGERISIVAFDQRVEAAPSLEGLQIPLPAARDATAWPLPGGNAEQAMEHVAGAQAFEVAWRRNIGRGSTRRSQVTAPPVAVDGYIFTMDGEAQVAATDARTGSGAWRTDLGRNRHRRDREAFGGGLAVAEGKVVASSGFRFVAALDSRTGQELWRTNVDAPIHAAPTIAGGRVFVVDLDNQIIALDLNTGEIAWSYQAIVEPARVLKASSPAVVGDSVVTPFSSGELVALRAANGNPLWTEVLSRTSRVSALSEIRDIAGRPAVYRGDVYAASHSGVFSAVDLRTGSRRWDLPVASINSPWPAGEAVFLVAQGGEMMAVNRATGQAYWVKDLNEGRRLRREGGVMGVGGRRTRPIWTGPLLVSDRLVVVNSEGEASAYDARTGELQRTIRLGHRSFIEPIAYGGMIYVVTDNGQLVAIR